eukprot:scaffold600_cov385-Prasinococcus_capsulatus_cf.AAC.15
MQVHGRRILVQDVGHVAGAQAVDLGEHHAEHGPHVDAGYATQARLQAAKLQRRRDPRTRSWLLA